MIAEIAHHLRGPRIRYAVVGLGHIAQAAVLPAFEHAADNSELVALVSDDPIKLQELGSRYNAKHTVMYQDYDSLMKSGSIDAVYIALPNHMHRDFAERAARAGIHVLCEKPMAMKTQDCEAMIRAANEAHVKLMIAYRLHFEEANLRALEIVRSGQIGEPKLFTSTFSMQVSPKNYRIDREKGGGPIYDIGIYCINAARAIFGDEPTEVFAFLGNSGDPRFSEVEESAAVNLYFPNGRLATFAISFGAAASGSYQVTGTKGSLCVENAYEYESPITHYLSIGDQTTETEFPKRDQFAAELIYFSKCILENLEPEPSGYEGLADIRIIDAIFESAKTTKSTILDPLQRLVRPTLDQEISLPPAKEQELVHSSPPSRE